jgi:hypothetical protein
MDWGERLYVFFTVLEFIPELLIFMLLLVGFLMTR